MSRWSLGSWRVAWLRGCCSTGFFLVNANGHVAYFEQEGSSAMRHGPCSPALRQFMLLCLFLGRATRRAAARTPAALLLPLLLPLLPLLLLRLCYYSTGHSKP